MKLHIALENSNYKLYVKNGHRDNYLSEPEFPQRLRLHVPKRPYNNNNSIYQILQVGLSASWSVGELVIGELNCQRVGLSTTWLSASCP